MNGVSLTLVSVLAGKSFEIVRQFPVKIVTKLAPFDSGRDSASSETVSFGGSVGEWAEKVLKVHGCVIVLERRAFFCLSNCLPLTSYVVGTREI